MSLCGGRGGGSGDQDGGEGGEGSEGSGGSGGGSSSPAPTGPAGLLCRRLRGASLMARRRPELLCGVVAVGCALLLALKFTCSRAKDVIIPAKPPVNFFSSRSPVLDLFQGQLDYAEYIRRDSEVVLLFFYAPWCGQSIAAKGEIEQVANRLADQVLFVAINCWWNQGKCRKQKHFFYFPVIYLYHRSFGPIEYKGPLRAVYIEKFVRRVMMPLLYIPSRSELLDFLSNYEVLVWGTCENVCVLREASMAKLFGEKPGVLGYFEFSGSPQPPGYLTFFTSALHSLKKDYLGTLRFGVITNKHLAKLVSLVHSGSVYLHRHFNTSLVFPREVMNYTAENIYKWALENREMLVQWLRPHGGKSLLLNNELKKGPALFLFIPFNPLAESHPLLDEITEVALEYNNCNKSQVVEQLLQHLRHVDSSTLDSLVSNPPIQLAESSSITESPCCNTVVLPQWHSISRTHNVCELCINQSTGIKPSKVNVPQCSFFEIAAALDSFYLKEHTFYQVTSDSIECSNFLSFYSPFSYYTACCRTMNRGLMSFTNSEEDIFQSPPIALSSHEKKCEVDNPTSVPHIEESIPLFPDVDINSTSITGLSCRTNKTLNLYLLDSNLFWLYAERLGASSSTQVKEFAAIVDVKEESHYILDPTQALVKPTLESFIQNFSVLYSPLKRHLIGSDTVHFPSQHIISEVTTDTFWEVVLRKQDVLLLYYARWCGFCASLNHVFIQLARLLPPDKFTVARIDIGQNDLPWEFMVDHLPTILFFPCNRKDLSVKFPEDSAITLPNLLKFILRYSDPISTVGSSADPQTKERLQNEAVLQKGHIAHLEKEIHKLRAEITSLHQAQAQVESQLSDARRDKHRLQKQKQTLEKQHSVLQLHSEQLEALYEQKTRELEEMAVKLQELADASENLLTENALLKILVATMEGKLENEESEKSSTLQETLSHETELQSRDNTKLATNMSSPMASEQNNENRTD
ncbi:thioredoxin domain-containing protein 11 isoform X1 [Gracilinanus agilis]|uniref:thioredoxin domain-containing protein 11 isoform X1 n=1 Tax=Gracilinanus agilis TaxID=191870 RepID=UPI001CFD7C3C|nr:thioredoxin domain-containing protein 11 isoform X1 [Gracilinanus agilis]